MGIENKIEWADKVFDLCKDPNMTSKEVDDYILKLTADLGSIRKAALVLGVSYEPLWFKISNIRSGLCRKKK